MTYSAFFAAPIAGHRLQQQRRLADAGIAAEQDDAARNQPAAQHAVEFLEAGREPWLFFASTVPSGRTVAALPDTVWNRVVGGAAIVSTSVFQAVQCGH